MDKTAASLGDDDLARTALVYKDTHGAKVVSLDRKHLTAHVEAVNSANGETYPFPPCFAEPAQYDPKDSSCGVECDFRRECAACIPAYRDPQIEAQLTQLKGAVAPVSKPKAPKPAAPQPEPVQATEPAKAAAPPAPPKVKKEKPPKPPPVGTIEEEAPKLLAEAIALRAPKLPKPKPPRKPRALPARIGPYSARIGPVTLSKRKGVEAPKYFRLPQGSAVALANLPVGTEKTRDYEGIRYTVVKVEDGKTHKTKGGMKRKLDGRWKITGKAKIQKDGSAKPFASVPDMVATLGRITRFITGKAWSAARFWSILPPLLDPKSPEFNPAAFKPVLIYAYGAGEEKPKGKAKKKAKPKKAPKKAKASSKKKAA